MDPLPSPPTPSLTGFPDPLAATLANQRLLPPLQSGLATLLSKEHSSILLVTNTPLFRDQVLEVLYQPLSRALLKGGFRRGWPFHDCVPELVDRLETMSRQHGGKHLSETVVLTTAVEWIAQDLSLRILVLDRLVPPANYPWRVRRIPDDPEEANQLEGIFRDWLPRDQVNFHTLILFALAPRPAFLIGCLHEALIRWPVPPGSALPIQEEWHPFLREAAEAYNRARTKLLGDFLRQAKARHRPSQGPAASDPVSQ